MVQFSRRQLLKTGLATGGAIAAGSTARQVGAQQPRFGRGPTVYVSQIQDVTLRFIGLGVSQVNEIAQKAKEDLGFTVEFRVMNTADLYQVALSQPRTWDMLDGFYQMMRLVVPSGNLQGIDISRLPEFDKITPAFTQGYLEPGDRLSQSQGTGRPYINMYLETPDATQTADQPTDYITLVPFQFNADTLGYRPDLVGRPIESWAEILNPEFQGKTALNNAPDVGLLDVAMAMEAAGIMTFEDKGNMTQAEMDRVTETLIDLKEQGQFRAFWSTFDESVNLMASGEVVLQSMWSPAVTVVKSKGLECIYAPLKEGYRSWAGGLGISKNLSGIELDAAYEYLNWTLDGWVGGFIGRQGYYCAIPENAKKFMSQAEWEFWYEGKEASEDILDPFGNLIDKQGTARDGGSYEDRVGNIVVWNSIMDQQQYVVQKWNEFLTA